MLPPFQKPQFTLGGWRGFGGGAGVPSRELESGGGSRRGGRGVPKGAEERGARFVPTGHIIKLSDTEMTNKDFCETIGYDFKDPALLDEARNLGILQEGAISDPDL